MATDKQIAFAQKIAAERVISQVFANLLEDIETMPTKQASQLIDAMLRLPRKSADVKPAEVEDGIYVNDDGTKIIKVYRGQSGRMLAKQLVKNIDEDGASFEYRGLAERFVTGLHKMSKDEAIQYGAIYGVCCNCGATLTDETSIAAGIGPVCAKRFA